MALHATTVEILVQKAKFEPKVALGVAEAIELAMTQAQFVTVPILDARLHEVRAEIRLLEGKLDASIKEQKADMQRLSTELNGKFDAQNAKLDAKIDAQNAKIEAKLAEMEARLVRWVFLVMLGNVALSLAATTVLNAFKTL
jgi:C4-dicarboxylate-specific signal transduction histidine kinase